jgi:hypothetical protein
VQGRIFIPKLPDQCLNIGFDFIQEFLADPGEFSGPIRATTGECVITNGGLV